MTNPSPSSATTRAQEDEAIVLEEFDKAWDERWWKVGKASGFTFGMTFAEYQSVASVYKERWPLFLALSGASFLGFRYFPNFVARRGRQYVERLQASKKSPFDKSSKPYNPPPIYNPLSWDLLGGVLCGAWAVVITQDENSLDQATAQLPLMPGPSGISDAFCETMLQEYARQWKLTERRKILNNAQNEDLQHKIAFAKNCQIRYRLSTRTGTH